MIDSSQLVSLQHTETKRLAYDLSLELLRDRGASVPAPGSRTISMASDDDQRSM